MTGTCPSPSQTSSPANCQYLSLRYVCADIISSVVASHGPRVRLLTWYVLTWPQVTHLGDPTADYPVKYGDPLYLKVIEGRGETDWKTGSVLGE